jgi:hypothetical protein
VHVLDDRLGGVGGDARGGALARATATAGAGRRGGAQAVQPAVAHREPAEHDERDHDDDGDEPAHQTPTPERRAITIPMMIAATVSITSTNGRGPWFTHRV